MVFSEYSNANDPHVHITCNSSTSIATYMVCLEAVVFSHLSSSGVLTSAGSPSLAQGGPL